MGSRADYERRSAVSCPDPEAHEAHMQMNGECPWCGAVDQSQIRQQKDYDFQDAHTLPQEDA